MRDSWRWTLATGVRVRGSNVLVARVALVNRDMLKHRTILVDSFFRRRQDGGSSVDEELADIELFSTSASLSRRRHCRMC